MSDTTKIPYKESYWIAKQMIGFNYFRQILSDHLVGAGRTGESIRLGLENKTH